MSDDDKKPPTAPTGQQVSIRTPKGVSTAVPALNGGRPVEYTPRITAVSKEDVQDAEISSAAVDDDLTDNAPEYRVNYDEKVTIKPRKTQARMFIGNKQYSFTAGKKCIVPRHVAIHLEEKGFL